MCSVLVEPTVAVDDSLHLDTPKLLTNTKPPQNITSLALYGLYLYRS